LPAAILVVVAVAALAVDCPLSSWCLADNCPGFFRDLFEVAESFGHGLGVPIILLVVYHLDPLRRRALPRVAAMSWGAGMMANVIKLGVARVRPHHFDFQGGVVDTFAGWLPLLSEGSGGQSFPSAHTATAVGLAFALAWLYPRGRWLFAGLAVLVAFQRIESGAHYLSDTLCGAAEGCIVAAVCLRTERVGGWFDRLETRLGAAQNRSLAEEAAARQSKSGQADPGDLEEPSRAA
jgi:membrane-associated phospholipid phosphatase